MTEQPSAPPPRRSLREDTLRAVIALFFNLFLWWAVKFMTDFTGQSHGPLVDVGIPGVLIWMVLAILTFGLWIAVLTHLVFRVLVRSWQLYEHIMLRVQDAQNKED